MVQHKTHKSDAGTAVMDNPGHNPDAGMETPQTMPAPPAAETTDLVPTPFAAVFNVTRTERQRYTNETAGYDKIVDLGMDSVNAYPAGGFPIPGETPGLVWGASNIAASAGATQYDVTWNLTTGLLQVFSGNTEFSGTFGAGTVLRVVVKAF